MMAAFRGGAPQAASSVAVERSRIGVPRSLFEFEQASLSFYCVPLRCYDVSADGQRFYVRLSRPASPRPPVTHIDVILNWVDEVKAKMAAGRRERGGG